jgi:hypothetical protein
LGNTALGCPDGSVTGVAIVLKLTAVGHEDRDSRRVVTQLNLD